MTIIYTDGSCLGNPGPGGYAFARIADDSHWYYSGREEHTTNNRMELTAVIEALKFFSKEKEYTIFTDSMYVKNGMEKWMVGWKKRDWKRVKNQDLWKMLDSLAKNKNITWKWVKGHSGNCFNEKVDKLARKEAQSFIKI